MKLRTLKSEIRKLEPKTRKADTLSDQRISGRPLQSRRLRLWTQNPCCVDCGKFTEYPHGFELDHEIPLEHGGPDTDDNCRIRCVWWEGNTKHGCHEAKTKRERAKIPNF